jgi:hypothetical protein
MTATATTSIDSNQTRRTLERLRRGPLSIRDMATALHDRWRAAVAAGQLGQDAEIIVGRGTGARI